MAPTVLDYVANLGSPVVFGYLMWRLLQQALETFRSEMAAERRRCDEQLAAERERADAHRIDDRFRADNQHAALVAGQREIRHAIKDMHGEIRLRRAVEDLKRGTPPEAGT